MKIAVIGGGFTGLSLALKLSKYHHNVHIFEKDSSLGGLAGTFKKAKWEYPLEKHYHHWFTNDYTILSLIKELGIENELVFPKTLTSIFYQDEIYPFNSPLHLLVFSPLKIYNRVRTGFILLYLKILPLKMAIKLEKYTAFTWLEKYFGKTSFDLLWRPLLVGKFGKYAKDVNMSWFWARIKKRTLKLGYLKGGYQLLTDKMSEKILKTGGKIFLNTPFLKKYEKKYDKVIFTAPSKIFTDIYTSIPQDYKNKLTQIPHLHALNLVLISKEKFLKDTYWLNINEKNFPFIAVVQQTNMTDSKHYNNQHITWVANYLPSNHPYLKMTPDKLLRTYKPFLKKINKSFDFSKHLISYQVFFGSFAQPVFLCNYSNTKPDFITPLTNVYLANMDMVYPWDRGTNYAVKLGFEMADFIIKNN